MPNQNLHEQLQSASRQIKEAQDAILQAQGRDAELLQQAHDQLQQAERELKHAQEHSGKTATENPQFQQAYESLHDTRQQVQEAQQNNSDVL
ncbi:hypothetical protein QNH47_14625 [Virgibacillus halodenitrificans]|uniref:hypothetical protein n=1 Tax=Virgibacillus halodenitrificans TaxID=1482 RepID=UPI0024C0C41E|nr:hypothetical protein [Virgibacillus halodenitrificans]WHX25382.1 hypothetical protein QNH47_14625 [Virgibacillus halodenitrificans]